MAASFDAAASGEAAITAAGLRPKMDIRFRLFKAEECRNGGTGAPRRPPAGCQSPLERGRLRGLGSLTGERVAAFLPVPPYYCGLAAASR